jgi:cyclohexyl-isocyanide hydratase
MERAQTLPQIGMLLYPGLTLQDLIGPETVFAHQTSTHLLSKTMDPVRSDSGVAICPTMTFSDCPKDLVSAVNDATRRAAAARGFTR